MAVDVDVDPGVDQLAAGGPAAGVRVFPVRHHSPRASVALRAFLDHVDPLVVLIEAPEDALDLLDAIADPETEPPVAILGYRTDGIPGSALWPFASYSPEFVAARWAHARGRRVGFIDLPVGRALAVGEREGLEVPGAAPQTGPESAPETPVDAGSGEGEGTADGEVGDGPTVGALDPEDAPAVLAALAAAAHEEPDLWERVAGEQGHRSFEEFWEASFEAPDYRPESFRDALLAWADLVRLDRARPIDLARDVVMAQHVAAAVDGGTPPDRIAVVVGAAHAVALISGDLDASLLALIPEPVPAAHTLIPYSFPRLAAQTGYGAGNRAPLFYQRAHDAGGDYTRATMEALVAFTDDLRIRGYAASLADTIEAYRLAVMLAQIRGKSGPGLDEVREAAIATLCRGDRTQVDGFLWSTVVGKAVGRVASSIGRNSLQDEFWREVEVRRLPRTDEPERVILHLNNPVEVGTSVFLHRLRVALIPYATFMGSAAERAGGAAALARPRETWEAQWTPATDAALVEAIVRGSTLEDLAADTLDRQLADATSAGAAADIALEAVVAGCPRTAGQALTACERLAADDLELASLATACRALSGLATYGTSREHSALGDAAVEPLLVKLFARAVLRVDDASDGTDEAVAPTRDALRLLHEVAFTQAVVDRAAWIVAARGLATSYAVNAGISGLATGLLYLAREIDDDELALLVGQRLSNLLEPVAAASFLAGFLEVNATALVRNRSVVAALDAYLTALPVDRFKEALPILRRAFSVLGASERRYLAEHLIALRGIGKASAAQSVLQQGDADALKAMQSDLSSLMDDLGDLL